MLKFPSDFNINSAYYELEETADGVMQNINKLIKVGETAKPPSGRSDHARSWFVRQRSLSEPSLCADDDVTMDTPLGSHHMLSQSPLLGLKVMDMRPDSVTSQSSSGETVYIYW